MDSGFVALLTAFLLLTSYECAPVPDSAGIIPLAEGLAYGGIPYGSVSGQLSDYFGPYQPINPFNRKADANDNNLQQL